MCFFKEKQGRSLTKTFSFPESSLREKELKCTMMILENNLIRISIAFLHISIVERYHCWKKWNCLALLTANKYCFWKSLLLQSDLLFCIISVISVCWPLWRVLNANVCCSFFHLQFAIAWELKKKEISWWMCNIHSL